MRVARPTVRHQCRVVVLIDPAELGHELFVVFEVAVCGVPDVEVAPGGELAGGFAVREVEVDVAPAWRLGLAGAEKGDLVGRRPGSVEDRPRERGHWRGFILAWSGREAPELRILQERRLWAQVGDECEVLSIRRPGSAADVVCRRRDARRLAAFQVGDPDACELVAVAAAIDLPGVVADLPRDRVVSLADEKSFLAAAGKEQHPLAVRRPLGAAGAVGKIGELTRLATLERHDPHLGFAGAVGGEEERAAVGREAWPGVVALRGRELVRPAAFEWDSPEATGVLVVFDGAADVHDGFAIGCDRETLDDDLVEEVFGAERPRSRFGRGAGLQIGFLDRGCHGPPSYP